MAMQKAKTGLAAKLGMRGREAFEGHKADETKLMGGGGELPAGIDPGIAQLVECKFDTYKEGENQGEYYFYAAGTVVSPKEVVINGSKVPIEGLRTSIMEPLCDTPNRKRADTDAHMQWVLNEFRKLGVNTKEIGFDDLENVAAALKEEAPYFRFRTWQGKPTTEYPDPRVNHDWRGHCEYHPDESDDVEDNTDNVPPPKAATVKTAPAPVKREAVPKVAPKRETVKALDADDLMALAEAADAGDDEAAIKLAGQAKLFNVDAESAPSWADVAQMIADNAEASEEEVQEEDAKARSDWQPEKGDVYTYKPKGSRKGVECEVTAVFEDSGKVNLKNLEDGKSTYKGVLWGDLETL